MLLLLSLADWHGLRLRVHNELVSFGFSGINCHMLRKLRILYCRIFAKSRRIHTRHVLVRAKFLFFMFSDQVTKVKDSAKVIVLIASAAPFVRIMTCEGLIRKRRKEIQSQKCASNGQL